MSGHSSIQWTDATWNPTRGCSIVSEGCHSCYAMKQAHRFSGPGRPFDGFTKATKSGPQWTGKVSLVESALDWPLRYKGAPAAKAEGRPTRIFVNSMSDLFHESLSGRDIVKVFSVMEAAKHHVFQVLTKRSARMRSFLQDFPPLPNVWLGVSAENQDRADERIPDLLATPAAVRFVSAEPLLSGINLERIPHMGGYGSSPCSACGETVYLNALDGYTTCRNACDGPSVQKLAWVILGGESGPKARPCDISWIRSIKDQCAAAGVPVFVKQLGAFPIDSSPNYFDDELTDSKGGDMAEWPAELRVREMPVSAS